VRLPVKNTQNLQRLLNALDALDALTAVGAGATLRKRLAKKTDGDLTGFLRAARRVSAALAPLRRTPIVVEADLGP
jgi:hypothetical protein